MPTLFEGRIKSYFNEETCRIVEPESFQDIGPYRTPPETKTGLERAVVSSNDGQIICMCNGTAERVIHCLHEFQEIGSIFQKCAVKDMTRICKRIGLNPKIIIV